MPHSTVVTPIRLYPLYCILYLCTPTLTRRHLQVLVALSFALVSDIFRSNFTVCTALATTSQALTASDFALKSKNLSFHSFCWKLARATTTLNFEHVCFIVCILSVFSHSSRPWAEPTDLISTFAFNPVRPFYFLCAIF